MGKVVDLEIAIWGVSPRDVVPTHMLHTLALNGGCLIVAEDDDQMVGMCLGVPARRSRHWFLWSHMAGVHPDYQRQGIGFQMKQAQREWAAKCGYQLIRWTFDPLQRGNANFNIHRLGVTANVYHVNYYGEMFDSINAGLPSDRLEVTWGQPASNHTDEAEPSFWLDGDGQDVPQQHAMDFQAAAAWVAIPEDINCLKREQPQLAMAWQTALRATLQTAFANHYTITDFRRVGQFWAYQLTAPEPWYLYVVRCRDDSLYTGITKDLERRIQQHNTGKGAAYTAARRPVRLCAAWKYVNQSQALKAEAAFKKQTRATKMNLMNTQAAYRDGQFVREA
jgi:predicted GNAT superfamily acetyltransferase/predicted GIY-YIG superfamily endonuclease